MYSHRNILNCLTIIGSLKFIFCPTYYSRMSGAAGFRRTHMENAPIKSRSGISLLCGCNAIELLKPVVGNGRTGCLMDGARP